MPLDLEKLFREQRARWERMTTREIAVELGVPVEALYRWARLGRVPGMTPEFLDERRRLDPLREIDRGGFDPGSRLIEYVYTWKRRALEGLKRYQSLEDLIERGFIRGKQGRFGDYASVRVFDRLAFFAGTEPIAFLDCQHTWFVTDLDPEDGGAAALQDDVDLVADYIEGLCEEPFRIRPSLCFLKVEAAQQGLMDRAEADAPISPEPAKGGEEENPILGVLSLQDLEPWEWPADARDRILEVLRATAAPEEERLAAAALAGDWTIVDDEIATDLLAVAGSAAESTALRARAALAFGPLLEGADSGDFDDAWDGPPVSKQAVARIRATLHELYRDESIPDQVRRGVLEASVRMSEAWHAGAIRAALASEDPAWGVTATLCMGYVQGFDAEIRAALDSDVPAIRYEAVRAAGNWGLAAAWEPIMALVAAPSGDRDLLLAAIEAAATIRPDEAPSLLVDLLDSEDEEIAEAAEEAMAEAACERAQDDPDED